MTIFIPYIGTGAFMLGVLWICFRLEHQRVFRLAYRQGWEAREEKAARWLRRQAAKEGRL